MKLVTFIERAATAEAIERVGVLRDERVFDITALVADLDVPAVAGRRTPEGLHRLLVAGNQALAAIGAAASKAKDDAWRPLSEVTLLAPIPRPGKIVAIGRNYAEHAKESGVAAPEAPRVISKFSSSVCGPGTVVPRPAAIVKLDYEVELAVIIGRDARDVSEAEALDHVAGYSILNDLSAREFQFDVSPAQTTFAKSMDGFCPFGPSLVTADEIDDPQTLGLRCWLNDELMQDGNTDDMIHSVRAIVSYVSRYLTLEVGDVIATGTPSGVGLGRTPPVWLRPGDRLRLEIDKLGTLEHSIG